MFSKQNKGYIGYFFLLNKGCPFLGFLLYPDRINLALRSRARFIKKIRMYDRNLKLKIWNEREYQNHVLPLLSFVKHANSKEFRKQIFSISFWTKNDTILFY